MPASAWWGCSRRVIGPALSRRGSSSVIQTRIAWPLWCWAEADADMAEALLARLDGVPTIVSEPTSGRIADELEVGAFPVLLRVDEPDAVVRAEHSLASLGARAVATR